MPKLGSIRLGKSLGYKVNKRYIWAACLDCGKERWVQLHGFELKTKRCHPCGAKFGGPKRAKRGPEHWHWRGGRTKMSSGYVEVWVPEDHPFAGMRNADGCIYEHRLVMAQEVNRCLDSNEIVHHINGIKDDNCPSNLEILSKSDHAFGHYGKRELIALVKELQQQLAEHNNG